MREKNTQSFTIVANVASINILSILIVISFTVLDMIDTNLRYTSFTV